MCLHILCWSVDAGSGCCFWINSSGIFVSLSLFWFLQLERVQQRLADRKMKIQVSESAIQLLGSLGYDPNYGARPVKRVIQQNVENELAKGILRGDFKDEDTVLVDTEVSAFSNGQLPQQKLVFRRRESGSDSPAENQEALSQKV